MERKTKRNRKKEKLWRKYETSSGVQGKIRERTQMHVHRRTEKNRKNKTTQLKKSLAVNSRENVYVVNREMCGGKEKINQNRKKETRVNKKQCGVYGEMSRQTNTCTQRNRNTEKQKVHSYKNH